MTIKLIRPSNKLLCHETSSVKLSQFIMQKLEKLEIHNFPKFNNRGLVWTSFSVQTTLIYPTYYVDIFHS